MLVVYATSDDRTQTVALQFNGCQDYVTIYITYQFVSGMKDIDLSPSPGFSFVKVYYRNLIDYLNCVCVLNNCTTSYATKHPVAGKNALSAVTNDSSVANTRDSVAEPSPASCFRQGISGI